MLVTQLEDGDSTNYMIMLLTIRTGNLMMKRIIHIHAFPSPENAPLPLTLMKNLEVILQVNMTLKCVQICINDYLVFCPIKIQK